MCLCVGVWVRDSERRRGRGGLWYTTYNPSQNASKERGGRSKEGWIDRQIWTGKQNSFVWHFPQKGDTPLHVAVRRSSTDTTEWMMFAGADPMAVNEVRLKIMGDNRYNSQEISWTQAVETTSHHFLILLPVLSSGTANVPAGGAREATHDKVHSAEVPRKWVKWFCTFHNTIFGECQWWPQCTFKLGMHWCNQLSVILRVH